MSKASYARVLALLGFGVVVGCSHSLGPVTTRAAFDLNCPEQSLQVVSIDDRTEGVTGCNQRATYLKTCDLTGWGYRNCRWVLNSPQPLSPAVGQPQYAPQPPPPPAPH